MINSSKLKIFLEKIRNLNTNLVILIEAVIGSVVGASVVIVITLIMCFKKRKVFCKKRNKKNKKENKQGNKESVKKHFVDNQSNNWATRTGENIKTFFNPKTISIVFRAKKGLDHQHVASG